MGKGQILSTTVKYNNVVFYDGLGSCPLITKNNQMISIPERFGSVESYSMVGVLSGQCLDFSDYIDLQRQFISNFSKDFQTLEIIDNGNTVLSRPYSKITNINFPSNQYIGLIPYEVTLECYPVNSFIDFYGVLEPVNQFNYTEGQDGIIGLEHVISCKGFNTSSAGNNALDNAKTFCSNLSGLLSAVAPIFITGATGNYCLKEVSENINRFEASYSLKEIYSIDPNGTPGILHYALDVQSGIDNGLTIVKLQGSVENCLNQDISLIRARYNALNTFKIANSGYATITSLSDLYTGYISSGISENPTQGKLTFDISFSNITTPDTWYNYTNSLNTDVLTDISTYDFKINFEGKGDLKSRFIKASGLYSNTDILLLAGSGYSGFNPDFDLNPNLLASSVIFNPFAGNVSVQQQYNNEIVPPSGLKSFNYTISEKPSLEQFRATTLINGIEGSGWVVFDLGALSRATISIQGDSILLPTISVETGLAIIKSEINSLKNTYVTGNNIYLENYSFQTGNKFNYKSITFSANYSAMWSGFI